MIAIGYITALFIVWTPLNAVYFNYISLGIWLIFSLYISNTLGMYQVPLFCILQILCLAGFAYQIILIMEETETACKPITFTEAVHLALTGNEKIITITKTPEEVEEEENIFVEQLTTPNITADEIKEPLPEPIGKVLSLKILRKAVSLDAGRADEPDLSGSPTHIRRSSSYPNSQINSLRQRYFLRKLRTDFRMSLDNPDDKVDTGKYMYGAVYACTGMLLWKHKWILTILILPICWYVVKQMAKYFGFWNIINNRVSTVLEYFNVWYDERKNALVPAHVIGLYKIYLIIDKKMRDILKASVDTVATIVVILAVLIFACCASIFIMIQVI